MRVQAGYGRWKGVKATAGETSVVLLPDNSFGFLKGAFKGDYEKGIVPSKGFMHLKWCLVFIVSHVPHSVAGEVSLELRDPGISPADPLPGTQISCALADLPRAVLMCTDYDLPLGKSRLKLGDRELRRMFFLHTKVTGFVGQGVAISLFPVWDCDFRSSCNNYVHVPATSIPIGRLVRTDLLNCTRQLKLYAEGTLLTLPRSSVTGSSFAQTSLIDLNRSETLPSSSSVEGLVGSVPPFGAPSEEDHSDESRAGTTGGSVGLVNGVSVEAPLRPSTVP